MRVAFIFSFLRLPLPAISRSISFRMDRNNSRGTATSAIWKTIFRGWRTIFAPIVINFSDHATARFHHAWFARARHLEHSADLPAAEFRRGYKDAQPAPLPFH